MYITLIGAKPLHISFNKEDWFIRVHGGTRYLVSFGPKKYDAIYEKVVLHMVFLIIMPELKLILMIIYH